MELEDILDYYEVTLDGEVYSLKNNKRKLLSPITHKKSGYVYVNLYINGERKFQSVHRLVALAYLPNPMNYPQINHIDHNRANNNLSNLEWCTAQYNVTDGKGVKVLDETTGITYPSITMAAEAIGSLNSTVWRAANGIFKHAKGHKFKVLKEN